VRGKTLQGATVGWIRGLRRFSSSGIGALRCLRNDPSPSSSRLGSCPLSGFVDAVGPLRSPGGPRSGGQTSNVRRAWDPVQISSTVRIRPRRRRRARACPRTATPRDAVPHPGASTRSAPRAATAASIAAPRTPIRGASSASSPWLILSVIARFGRDMVRNHLVPALSTLKHAEDDLPRLLRPRRDEILGRSATSCRRAGSEPLAPPWPCPPRLYGARVILPLPEQQSHTIVTAVEEGTDQAARLRHHALAHPMWVSETVPGPFVFVDRPTRVEIAGGGKAPFERNAHERSHCKESLRDSGCPAAQRRGGIPGAVPGGRAVEDNAFTLLCPS